ncbi:MAG TPA: PQQ-binding-like beta-propeller repeat protein, partial [Gemmatimonadaceae bacterium]|nr:PQQ-binding-like beta-propeller repeat protein [Gemmatimonadaceae bacterium]
MNPRPEGDRTPRNPTSISRWAAVALLSLQLIIFEVAIASPARFPRTLSLRLLVAAIGALAYLAAIASLTLWRDRSTKLRWTLLAVALAISFRFYSPLVFARIYPPPSTREIIAGAESPTLVAFLRELSAAEEQYRLVNRTYSTDAAALHEWMPAAAGRSVDIRVRGDTGWAARVTEGKKSCTIWIRDSSLRKARESVEGSPTCGTPETRTRLRRIKTVLAPPLIESPFDSSDITGEWRQHRADAQRSGVASLNSKAPAYRWTTLVGGPVRSPVAIAGNQVFIGAHTNGEIAALSLDSGKAGFRVRAPNWIHHEPVITDRLVIFGFGNNEPSNDEPSFLGSPPSGIVAYDRLTGREVWRRYTRGSVMSSPVLLDSLIVIVTGSHEVIAYRARDGTQLRSTKLPDYSPMANPAVVDSLFIIGVEPATVCAVGVRSGRKVYCHILSSGSWGAGHASAAIAGDLVLQVYEEDLDGSGGS